MHSPQTHENPRLEAFEKLEALILARKQQGKKLTDYNFFDINGRCLLHYAALLNDLEKIKHCLTQKADINRKDLYFGETPLQFALEEGNLQAAKYLYEAGAECSEIKLEEVSDTNCREWVKGLIKTELQTIENNVGFAPRWLKLDKETNTVDVKSYWQRRIEIDDAPEDMDEFEDRVMFSHEIITLAAANGSMKILKLYENRMIHYSAFSGEESPLNAAIKHDQVDTLQFLLEKINPNTTGKLRMTPLHTAVVCGRLEMVDLLLNKGAFLGFQTNNVGSNEFHAICITGNATMLKKLLPKATPALLNQPDVFDKTPLDWAILKGHDDIISLLTSEEKLAEIKRSTDYKKFIDISQIKLAIKTLYYLQLNERDTAEFKIILGLCHGFEFMSTIYKDPYYFSTLQIISSWDGNETALQQEFPNIPQRSYYKNLQMLFEQWSNDVFWFQYGTEMLNTEITLAQFLSKTDRSFQLDVIADKTKPINFQVQAFFNQNFSVAQFAELLYILMLQPLNTNLSIRNPAHTARVKFQRYNHLDYYDSNFPLPLAPIQQPLRLAQVVFDNWPPGTSPQYMFFNVFYTRLAPATAAELRGHHKIAASMPLPSSKEEAEKKQNASPNKFTLTHFAIITQNPFLLQRVIASGLIDINAKDRFGDTPLMQALKFECDELLPILCDPKNTDLHIDKELIVKYKYAKHFDLLASHPNADLTELIEDAYRENNIAVLKNLVAKKIIKNPNALVFGLYMAVQSNNLDGYKLFIGDGTGLYTQVKEITLTPLRNLPSATDLYAHALLNIQDINKIDEDGNTLAHYIVYYFDKKRQQMLHELIDRNLDIYIKSDYKKSILDELVIKLTHGHEYVADTLQLLKEKGLLNKLSESPETLYRLLHHACAKHDLPFFKFLLWQADKNVLTMQVKNLANLVDTIKESEQQEMLQLVLNKINGKPEPLPTTLKPAKKP